MAGVGPQCTLIIDAIANKPVPHIASDAAAIVRGGGVGAVGLGVAAVGSLSALVDGRADSSTPSIACVATAVERRKRVGAIGVSVAVVGAVSTLVALTPPTKPLVYARPVSWAVVQTAHALVHRACRMGMKVSRGL